MPVDSSIMLSVIWFRCLKGHFSKEHHFGFEAEHVHHAHADPPLARLARHAETGAVDHPQRVAVVRGVDRAHDPVEPLVRRGTWMAAVVRP